MVVGVVVGCVFGGDQMCVGEVRAGWVEAEEFVEDDLELSVRECRLHVFDAVVYVWQAGSMVEERRRGPTADFLVDLKGCLAAELPDI